MKSLMVAVVAVLGFISTNSFAEGVDQSIPTSTGRSNNFCRQIAGENIVTIDGVSYKWNESTKKWEKSSKAN